MLSFIGSEALASKDGFAERAEAKRMAVGSSVSTEECSC